jgi:hypothetical protein
VLVILQLFKGLLFRGVRDYTRRVNHAWAEEPAVEVVTSVIVISNLFLICSVLGLAMSGGDKCSHTLRSGVHDNLRCEAEEDELEEADSEPEARPVMSVLQHLEAVTVEVDIALKVHVVEGLHGDLVPSTVLELIRMVLEGQVVLDWAARELDFFVLAGDEGRRDTPEGDEDRDGGEEAEEDCGLQATTDLPRQVEGDNEEEKEEELVGKAVTTGAVRREGSIFDGGILDAELAAFD